MTSVTNYNIEDADGASVRTDLNNVFAAIQSNNSEGSDLSQSQCVAGMFFLNTTSNVLKIRDSTNNTFTDIGNINTANLGLLPATGGTLTGQLLIDDSSSASSPALSFDGDTDLGLFRKTANIMGFSSSGTEQMTFDANGITLNTQNEIRFGDADSSNHVGIKAPSTVASNKTITLPDETGTLLTSASSIASTQITGGQVTVGSTAIALGATATTIAGLTTLTSTNLRATNFQDSSGNTLFTGTQITQGRLKAWANFNNINDTTLDSFGISSIAHVSTGVSQVNFTTSFSNANYCVTSMCRRDVNGGGRVVTGTGTPAASNYRIESSDLGNSRDEQENVYVMFSGDT
tara:strand:+ start:65 stop:1105 length:1041 start_codon:yes stop_codon:yes gene_type:complete